MWGSPGNRSLWQAAIGVPFPITSHSTVVVSSPSVGIVCVSCGECGLASDEGKSKSLISQVPNSGQKGRDPNAFSEIIFWLHIRSAEASWMWYMIQKSKWVFPKGNINSVPIMLSVKCLGASYPLCSGCQCRGRQEENMEQTQQHTRDLDSSTKGA